MKLHKLPLLILLCIAQSNMGMENNRWHTLPPEIILYIASFVDNKASFAMINKQCTDFIQQHTLLKEYPRCLHLKDHMNFMVKYAKKENIKMINLGLKTGLLCNYDYLNMLSSVIPTKDPLTMIITEYKVKCNYDSYPQLPEKLIEPLISFLKGDIDYINAYKKRLHLANEQDRGKLTPLHVAVNLCDINFASLFLAQDPTLLNKLPLSENTDLQIITPLAIAIYKKDLEMCKFLLSFKNIELDSLVYNQNLLEYSPINNSFDILKLIAHILKQKYNQKKYISFFTKNALVATINHEQELLFLLNEINYILPNATQPLHIIITHMPSTYSDSVMKIIKNIINHQNTNINAQDENGNTPLLLAIHRNYDITYINYLLEKGADPTIKNNDLQTVLHLSRDNDLMNRLLKTDALNYINCQNKNGRTPLLFCITNGSHSNLKILLQAGANPNIADKFGETPLIRAAYYNCYQKIELLLNYGADPSIQDNYNKTAYDYAFEKTRIQDLFANHKKNI